MKKNLVKVPEFASKGEAFAYLRKHASDIIAQKKAFPTTTDDLEFGYSIIKDVKQFTTKSKQKEITDPESENEIAVDVIANMSGWCDSQMDVMIKDSWAKSINDLGASGQKLFYHLKNHGTGYQYTTDSVIGRSPELYPKDIDLSIFNFKSDIKKAQALCMRSIVPEAYDCKSYYMYRDGEAKQHSIGLRYIKLYLCMDSDEAEDVMYKENWDKYYPGVINKEKVDSKGFFWAVVEAQILEVSLVLFGSNELTPTMSTETSTSTQSEPVKSTQEEPLSETKEGEWDLGVAILTTKFFN